VLPSHSILILGIKTTDHMHNKKVWFITGTSHGLGLAFVRQLLERGDQVAATTRSITSLSRQIIEHNWAMRNLAQLCQPSNICPSDNEPPVRSGALAGNFLPMQVDLTDERSIEKAIAATCKTFGRIDVVVNNAGYAVHGTADELGPAAIDRCFAINTVAPITIMHKVLPYLKKQGSGYILNISSLSACAAATDIDLYAAAKHAVLGVSDILREDLCNPDIRITVVAPAAFQAQLWAREYFTLENIRLDDHAAVAAGFIRLADDAEPPRLLLLDNHADILKIQKHTNNEVQFVR
jgi:NAD(P)-dependent dehydrogenase (short-subunit alcohol dehydrogenase family)